MKILVLNCGSSSLKFQVIDMENEEEKKEMRAKEENILKKVGFERIEM